MTSRYDRKFEGKTYRYYAWTRWKKTAIEQGKRLRKDGYRVRIAKEKMKSDRRKFRYTIYRRRRR